MFPLSVFQICTVFVEAMSKLRSGEWLQVNCQQCYYSVYLCGFICMTQFVKLENFGKLPFTITPNVYPEWAPRLL